MSARLLFIANQQGANSEFFLACNEFQNLQAMLILTYTNFNFDLQDFSF
jgi:hypothetical protein